MASLVSYALTTLADVKENLGLDAGNTTKDNLIIRKINQATEMIEGYCQLFKDHHFVEATYTQEEYDGTGINQLILRMRPATSLTSFQYRDTVQNQDSWTDVDSEQYFLDQQAGVIDINYTLPKYWNRFRTTYVAGYSAANMPSDLSEACATLATFMVDNVQTGNAVKSKTEGARKLEYFQASDNASLIESLGLDESLDRYVDLPLIDDV